MKSIGDFLFDKKYVLVARDTDWVPIFFFDNVMLAKQ